MDRDAVRPVQWGLPDAALCWLLGVLGGVIAAVPAVVSAPGGGHTITSTATFLAVLPAQNFTMLAGLFWVSRTKGLGAWTADFGLELRRRDAGAVLVGIALQLLLTLTVLPLSWVTDRAPSQELVRLIGDNRNPALVAGILASTVIVAPLVEELLFRGLLLRSLLRRMGPGPAIAVSGVIFGAVHLVDPGALIAVPALSALGMVLSTVAVRTNSLSRPILIHAGFNLTATIAALTMST